jgi:hypothetical protein
MSSNMCSANLPGGMGPDELDRMQGDDVCQNCGGLIAYSDRHRLKDQYGEYICWECWESEGGEADEC